MNHHHHPSKKRWREEENPHAFIEAFGRIDKALTSLDLQTIPLSAIANLALAEFLRSSTTLLLILNLNGCGIGTEGAQAVAEALKVNEKLTSLDFGMNPSGTQGVLALVSALEVNVTLTHLSFGCVVESSNEDCTIGPQGALALAAALTRTDTALTSLDVRANNIDARGAAYLSQALERNTMLTSLNLGGNYIQSEGVLAVVRALKINGTLVSLVLGRNYIGSEGALALSEVLRTNTALTSLDLQRMTSLSTEFFDALAVNKHLKNLNLKDGFMGTEHVAAALSKALESNTALTSLDLGGNHFHDEGAAQLSKALVVNRTLTSLVLNDNYILCMGTSELAKALRTNKTITRLGLTGNRHMLDAGARELAIALRCNPTMVQIAWDFGLSRLLYDDLSPAEQQMDDSELLAHWRYIRRQAKTFLMTALGDPPLMDTNIFHEIFEYSGDSNF